MAIKITDLVDPNEIEKIKQLDAELSKVLDTYTKVAKDLAKGLEISVSVVGDIDKLERWLIDKSRDAATAQQQLTRVIDEQGKVIANTTNTISRQLMEQERQNKTRRENHTELERAKALLEQYNDTYENQVKRVVQINQALTANKKAQSENERAYTQGKMTMEQLVAKQAELLTQHRSLTQEKRTLTQVMAAEEKAAQSQEGSYTHMSQQLELMKKSYKELGEEGRNSSFGTELENAIQNLDAHLKDMAADMGEFQRNVGNYAIAGQNGVVNASSLIAVLEQEAKTTQDLADQIKILEDGRRMLDTTDEAYADTVARVDAAIESNKRQLSDVSDIMDKQASSVSEAESQNKRLVEAIKLVDLTCDDASEKLKAMNDKVAENNRVIESAGGQQQSIKKSLKDLVLEIATLTIQYDQMTEAEKKSASGQELLQKINDLTEQAGVLKDAIADTNAAISNAASDTRTFDQISEGIQLCIDGFGLATGAAQMLGLSESDLVEVQAKLQAAFVASNAVQSVQNALQKQSALMQGVSILQTKAQTLAIKSETAAKGKGRIATIGLTAAQKLFNLAAKANPIGLLVTGITVAIGAVVGLTKVFNIFGSDSAKRKQAYKNEAKQLEELKAANDRAIATAKARGASEWAAANMAIDAKKAEMEQAERAFARAKEAYDDDDDEYKEALDSKNAATQEYLNTLDDSYNKVIEWIQKYRDKDREREIGHFRFKKEKLEEQYKDQKDTIERQLKAQTAADESLISHYEYLRKKNHKANAAMFAAYENALKRIAALRKEAQENLAALDEAYASAQKENEEEERKRAADAAKRARDEAKRKRDALISEIRKNNNAQISLMKDRFARETAAENEDYRQKKTDLSTRLKELGKNESQMRTQILKGLKILEKQHAANLAKITRDEVAERSKIRQDLLKYQLESGQLTADEELKVRKDLLKMELSEEKRSLQERYDAGLISGEEYAQALSDINSNHLHETEMLEIDSLNKKNEHAVTAINQRYAEEESAALASMAKELAAAGSNAEKRQEIEERYAAQSADRAHRQAIEILQVEIDAMEEILQKENLTEEERLKYAEKLRDAKISLSNEAAQADIDNTNKAADNDAKALEKRMAKTQQWLQTASQAMSALNDLGSAIFDAKIQRIEEEQEALDEAAEKENERTTALVEKGIITQEEGEARKRAAEAKTAKKNEELEKKKQQLKHKQALWDKANSAAQAGIATALSLIQLWKSPGFPAAIPLMAVVGALGALQVATILATPIPKYAKGTDRHKGGMAIVGDGGVPELVTVGAQSWVTPDKPTLVDLPAGAIVRPSIDVIDKSLLELPSGTSSPKEKPFIINNDYRRLEEKMDRFISILSKHAYRSHQDNIDMALANYISQRI